MAVKAALDRAYWIAEAGQMASVLSALASSTGTPWAVSDAAVTGAHAAWVGMIAVSKEVFDVTKATSQSVYEIALADARADSTWRWAVTRELGSKHPGPGGKGWAE